MKTNQTESLPVAVHTPGPWTTWPANSGCRFTITQDPRSLSGSPAKQVCEVIAYSDLSDGRFQDIQPTEEQADANARLIAAAPELLAALKSAADSLDVAFNFEGDVFGVHHNNATDALTQARAAIAKAKGEA